MHGDGADLLAPAELLDQPVGAVLGAHEDEGAATLAVLELAEEGLHLRLVGDMDELVLDLADVFEARLVHVGAGVDRVGLGQLSGGTFEGGREEERLAVVTDLLDDAVDGGLEAHVEHAVGFVENQVVHVVQVEGTALEQVLEAAGAGDNDVCAGGALGLGLDSDATVDGGDREGAGGCDRFDLVDDLAGQLAGRREDECRGPTGVGGDHVDQRDSEGKGLAGAGGRLDQHVVAVEDVLDDLLLDLEGGFDASLGEGFHYGFGHAEIGEGLR